MDLQELLPLLLTNFGLAMTLLAMLFILLHLMVNLFTKDHTLYEIIYSWISLLAVGFTGIYAFIMHVFFPVTSAAVIGWHVSPFQFEVGMANLGFGLVAIFAFWGSYSFRLASVVGVTCWLWGDAIGHIYQMILKQNYTVGNAGSWFWLDIILPFVLIFCITKMRLRAD